MRVDICGGVWSGCGWVWEGGYRWVGVGWICGVVWSECGSVDICGWVWGGYVEAFAVDMWGCLEWMWVCVGGWRYVGVDVLGGVDMNVFYGLNICGCECVWWSGYMWMCVG